MKIMNDTMRNVILTFGVIAAAAACGYWLGLQHVPESDNVAAVRVPVASAATAAIEAKLLEMGQSGELSVGLNGEVSCQSLIDSVDKSEIRFVLEFSDSQLPKEVRLPVLMALTKRWAMVDGAGAMRYVEGLRTSSERQRAISTLAVIWMEYDAPGAIAWWKRLPEGQFRQRTGLAMLTSRSIINDPQTAWTMAQSLDAYRSSLYGIGFILGKLATKDPGAALAGVARLADNQQKHQARMAIATSWATVDPQAAMLWASSLQNPSEKDSAIENVLGSWIMRDVEAAAASVIQLPNGPLKTRALMRVLPAWALKNERAATEYIRSLPAGNEATGLLDSIVMAWAERDGTGALAYAQSLPSGASRNRMESIVSAMLARESPQALGKLLESLPDNDDRRDIINMIAGREICNLETAIAVISALPEGPVRTDALNRVGREYSVGHPQHVVDLVAKLPDSNVRDRLIVNAASDWAKMDLAAALAWIKTVLACRGKESGLEAVCWVWVQQNPAEALPFVLTLPPDEWHNRLIGFGAGTWARADIRNAVGWLKSLTNECHRAAFLGGLIPVMAKQDSRGAIELAATMPEGEARRNILAEAVKVWAALDPATAAAWASDLPEDPRREMLTLIVTRWATDNPAQAGKWITDKPQDPLHVSLMFYFVNTLAQVRPDLAAQWVDAAANQKQRRHFIMTIAQNWLRFDPTAATNWLVGVSLPDEDKRLLLTTQGR